MTARSDLPAYRKATLRDRPDFPDGPPDNSHPITPAAACDFPAPDGRTLDRIAAEDGLGAVRALVATGPDRATRDAALVYLRAVAGRLP